MNVHCSPVHHAPNQVKVNDNCSVDPPLEFDAKKWTPVFRLGSSGDS